MERGVMYYLTIGYPLGAEIVEGRQTYGVSLKSRTVRLIPLEYRIWSKFLLGAYEDDVKKTLSDQDRTGLVPTMNKLLQTGMLIAFPDGEFSGMRELIFLRQGMGIGLDMRVKAYCVEFRGKIQLSEIEYDVWKKADGEITYGELERRMLLKHQNSVFEIQGIVIGLCRRGLLLSINKEGDATDGIF